MAYASEITALDDPFSEYRQLLATASDQFALERDAALEQFKAAESTTNEYWEASRRLNTDPANDDTKLLDAAHDELVARYGGYDYLIAEEERLAVLYHHRDAQAVSAGRDDYPSLVLYADEVDPRLLAGLIPSEVGLGDDFGLEPTDNPPIDLAEASRRLRTLPFVPDEVILDADDLFPGIDVPKIEVRGLWQIPTERIISADPFDDWAGDGRSKTFTPRNISDAPQTSIGAIVDYAQMPFDHTAANDSGTHITLARDTAGRTWAYAHTNGTHRLAAAKLRGDPTTTVSKIDIYPPEATPIIPFDVEEWVRHRSSSSQALNS